MRKIFVALSLVLFFAAGPGSIQAQPESLQPPLIISGTHGDDTRQWLYQYVNDAWELLPVDGCYGGAFSPIKYQMLACLSFPPFLDSLVGGRDWLFGTAWDIKLVDSASGTVRDLAHQPETIAANSDGNGYMGGIKRSVPVWSPDGMALAWTEQDYPSQNLARLIIYDLNNDSAFTLDGALPQTTVSSDGLPEIITWGASGIVVFTNDPSSSASVLRFYDRRSGLQQEVHLPGDELDWPPQFGPVWVINKESELESDRLVLQAASGAWYQVSAMTTDVLPLGTWLDLLSTSHPAESLRLAWNVFAGGNEAVWQIQSADGSTLLSRDTPLFIDERAGLTGLAINPSGQALAYLHNGGLYLWENQVVTEIRSPEDFHISALYWGQAQWQTGTAYSGAAG